MPVKKTAVELFALPYAPVQPLPPTDGTVWVPTDKKCRAFYLGNWASVEEVSGSGTPEQGRWRWRVCKFGGDTAVCDRRDKAMRAAEFSLGLGEMPVRLPEVANKKGAKQ